MTEYQAVIGIRLIKPHRDGRMILDYCRETVQAQDDEHAKALVELAIKREADPEHGKLFLKTLEVWVPRVRMVYNYES